MWQRLNINPSRLLLATAIGAGGFLFLLGVWPTPFRYDHTNFAGNPGYLIRINRWTGSADLFLPDGGWTRIEQLR